MNRGCHHSCHHVAVPGNITNAQHLRAEFNLSRDMCDIPRNQQEGHLSSQHCERVSWCCMADQTLAEMRLLIATTQSRHTTDTTHFAKLASKFQGFSLYKYVST